MLMNDKPLRNQKYAQRMRTLLTLVILASASVACSDPADFRPAKGAENLKPTKTAYRVPQSVCDSIGFVKRAESIEDIAETVANNGGTEFVVQNDNQSTTMETDFQATKTFGVVHGTASTRAERHHVYTAEAFRCR
jgi:hypothetical protein